MLLGPLSVRSNLLLVISLVLLRSHAPSPMPKLLFRGSLSGNSLSKLSCKGGAGGMGACLRHRGSWPSIRINIV